MVMSKFNNTTTTTTTTTKEKDSKRFFVVVWNCAAEIKNLLLALLFLFSVAFLLQLSSRFSSLSPSDLRHCLSTTTVSPPTAQNDTVSAPPPPPQEQVKRDEVLPDGVLKRGFRPYGAAAYNFILMSAYRGGPTTFSVMGLSSKPLHLYGKPTYTCLWVPHKNPDNQTLTATGVKILPDWGYGRVYTVVVVNCTFPTPAGAEGHGGKLLLEASTNDVALNNHTDTILAIDESPHDYDKFKAEYESVQPKYDYLYCGSSLYGGLSPQRVREWLAYHVRLFGPRAHFVIHDAGGVHEEVREVLRPWMEKGFVTLQDIREQEVFDGYYHNQFLIVNDCLHRYKFAAKWMFFFDVDEFVFVPKRSTIKSVLDSLEGFTQFTIEQMTMSSKICLEQDAPTAFRKWGIEKLVFKDVKRGIRRDRKYAVQPRNVLATGVHMSQNIVGKTTHKTEGRISYFHYHGTIANRREPCRQFTNSTKITSDGIPYVMDNTMRNVAGAVKRFEHKMIGSTLHKTRQ